MLIKSQQPTISFHTEWSMSEEKAIRNLYKNALNAILEWHGGIIHISWKSDISWANAETALLTIVDWQIQTNLLPEKIRSIIADLDPQ